MPPSSGWPSTPAIGLDIGGTKIMAGVLTSSGPGPRLRADTPTTGPGAILAQAVDLITRVAEASALDRTVPVGVGSAGQIDPCSGAVRSCTRTLPFAGLPLRSRLATALGRPVLVQNDCDAAALGEALVGAASGCRVSVTVMLGTGIGGGVVIDGHLLRGTWGRAAEVGHIQLSTHGPLCSCGRHGCAEAFAGGLVLDAAARARDLDDARALMAAAAGSDPAAQATVDTAARWTARLLTQLVVCYDPERIVLGGSLVSGHDGFYLQRIRSAFHPTPFLTPLPPLVPAELGPDAVWVGAALAAQAVPI